MVAAGRGPGCGTSAARANGLVSRRARAATAAAAHVQSVRWRLEWIVNPLASWLTVGAMFAAVPVAPRPPIVDPSCGVLQAALAFAAKDSSSASGMLRLDSLSRPPWSYWNALAPAERTRLTNRVSGELQVPEEMVAQLGAQSTRRVVHCEDVGVALTDSTPPAWGSSATFEASSVVWAPDSTSALLYVGWRNAAAGLGMIYRLDRVNGHWRVERSASAWVQ